MNRIRTALNWFRPSTASPARARAYLVLSGTFALATLGYAFYLRLTGADHDRFAWETLIPAFLCQVFLILAEHSPKGQEFKQRWAAALSLKGREFMQQALWPLSLSYCYLKLAVRQNEIVLRWAAIWGIIGTCIGLCLDTVVLSFKLMDTQPGIALAIIGFTVVSVPALLWIARKLDYITDGDIPVNGTPADTEASLVPTQQ